MHCDDEDRALVHSIGSSTFDKLTDHIAGPCGTQDTALLDHMVDLNCINACTNMGSWSPLTSACRVMLLVIPPYMKAVKYVTGT